MAHDRTQAPRRVDQPQPGLFKLRLVRGGPWVAAEIECDALGAWTATIDAERRDGHPDPAQAADVFRIWHYGTQVDASEHAFLVERARWARIHSPDAPEANPTRAIRVGSLPPAF